jgi:hypothetical protein
MVAKLESAHPKSAVDVYDLYAPVTLLELMADPHTKRCFIAAGVHVAHTEPLSLDVHPGFYASKSDVLVYRDDGEDDHGSWGYSKTG